MSGFSYGRILSHTYNMYSLLTSCFSHKVSDVEMDNLLDKDVTTLVPSAVETPNCNLIRRLGLAHETEAVGTSPSNNNNT